MTEALPREIAAAEPDELKGEQKTGEPAFDLTTLRNELAGAHEKDEGKDAE